MASQALISSYKSMKFPDASSSVPLTYLHHDKVPSIYKTVLSSLIMQTSPPSCDASWALTEKFSCDVFERTFIYKNLGRQR